jgi:hypothetical protein
MAIVASDGTKQRSRDGLEDVVGNVRKGDQQGT